MRARPPVLAILLAVFAVFSSRAIRAESSQAVDKIVALNKSAIAAFTAGDAEKAKAQLLDAVVLGKESGLGMHAAMARTYVHLGVVYVDGLKDREKGVRYFAMAQKVRSDIELTPSLASKTVVAAFQEAKGEAGKSDKPAAKAEAKAEAKPEPKAEAKAEVKKEEPKKEAVVDTHERDKARADADKLQKEVALVREAGLKERAEKERLQKLVAEKDKALAEKDKQLVEAKAGEKKEHEAREKLAQTSLESAKALAETTARAQKEREAREKLEKEKQLAAQQEKERKDRETAAKVAREKQVDGPEVPATIPQPLYCAGMDEAVVSTELFAHCLTQEKIKPKAMVLYYRPAGVAHFDALTMSRTKKGWWTTSIPAARVTGKTLQYYVEARDAKDDVTASNGKSTSPNITTLVASAEALSKKPAGGAGPDKVAAVAKPPAKKTAAHQKVKAHR